VPLFGNFRDRLLVTGLAFAALFGSAQVALGNGCKPHHFRAPYFIKSMGACAFDSETLRFAGAPAEQAMCLMRGMDATRNLAPTLQSLPAALAGRVGTSAALPSREALSGFLSGQNLEWEFAAYLWQPISRAYDNDPDAPMARYFVIHDTSGPYFGHRAFPDDINVNPKINNLRGFACSDEWGKAHVVVNRMGDMLVNHDFSIPWRETKFEQAVEFGGALKGLFVHIEMIQPRRSSGRGDGRSPDPAFTPAQYDRLALLYAIASVRSGRWLIPAFHAALDSEIRNGHDDPLNFNVQSFADSLDRLVDRLQEPEEITASIAAPTTDAQAEGAPPNLATWVDAQWDTPRKESPPSSIGAQLDPSQTPGGAPAAEGDGAQAMLDSVPNSAALPVDPNATAKSPAPHAKVALNASESSRDQKTAATESCKTRFAQGHSRRICESDRGEERQRGRRAVRTVGRRVSDQGHGARHHGGDLHTRHARGAAGHHRA
jgi:hypothetical protein